MQKAKQKARRVGIAVGGGLLLIVGIIAIPYPGPGWLIVFTALAILATEFTWAQRLLDHAKGRYDRWEAWLKRQPAVVRWGVIAMTGLVVVVTLWLLNIFGTGNAFFHLNMPWLNSPLGIFQK